jgi:hypothetical protein
MSDRDEEIRKRAYTLWERAGRPEARSEEFWHAAQAEIEGEARSAKRPGPV